MNAEVAKPIDAQLTAKLMQFSHAGTAVHIMQEVRDTMGFPATVEFTPEGGQAQRLVITQDVFAGARDMLIDRYRDLRDAGEGQAVKQIIASHGTIFKIEKTEVPQVFKDAFKEQNQEPE